MERKVILPETASKKTQDLPICVDHEVKEVVEVADTTIETVLKTVITQSEEVLHSLETVMITGVIIDEEMVEMTEEVGAATLVVVASTGIETSIAKEAEEETLIETEPEIEISMEGVHEEMTEEEALSAALARDLMVGAKMAGLLVPEDVSNVAMKVTLLENVLIKMNHKIEEEVTEEVTEEGIEEVTMVAEAAVTEMKEELLVEEETGKEEMEFLIEKPGSMQIKRQQDGKVVA